MNTYKSLSQWHNFRLRLFAEGILIGIFSGLVICFFRYALHEVEHYRGIFYQYLTTADWTISAAWLCCLVTLAYVLNKLNQIEPLAAGSGIPQVKGAILGLIKMRWLSILWVKLTAGILGIGAGLSLGREGPCIQMGAATAALVSGLWERFTFSGHIHIAAGAAAGMTAAFGSPIAGIFFVFEEMKTRFTKGGLLVVACAVTASELVTQLVFGFGLIFPFEHFQPLPFLQSWLYPDMNLRPVIDLYLAEGIDLNSAGLYSEKSFGYSAPINNHLLCFYHT
ncbi:MAG: chloride channel protein, partial [Paludibacteraceae bacterium]|nr:chloride channel protein [Paludibacteraceae bacterium]